MSEQQVASVAGDAGPLVAPWPVLGVGLGLVAMGWIWGLAWDGSAPGLRVLLLSIGLVAVGAGLSLYVPRSRADLEGRLSAAGVWLLGALAAYLARVGLGSQFDSLVVLLQAMTLAAVLGAVLTALPVGWRLVGGSVLLLLHFGAILTAVTVVPPPNGAPPWLANQVWLRWTRPYLQFTLLNNGYHFYAPEPGPASLVWFRVEFADGASRWVRIPDHATCRNQVERRRWGALASVLGQTVPVPPAREDELRRRRIAAGEAHRPRIPVGDVPANLQYRELSNYSILLLGSYVRRVARTTTHPQERESLVRAIKVYRVDYYNPPVEHFQAGREPLDPTLYLAYYCGEYDPNGRLSAASMTVQRDEAGREVERIQDPFLYWLIPIVRQQEQDATPAVGPRRTEGEAIRWQGEGKVINYVRIHAGDGDEEGVP
jgi:hypothetical protein